MNRLTTIALRLKSLALAAALACGFALPAAQAATVTLTGTTGQSCTYTSAQTDSSGNVTYVCQSSVTPPPPPPPPPDPTVTPPQCALITTATVIAVGGSITFTGGCLNANGVLTSSNASAPPAQLAVPVTFTAAGVYTYTMTGTNAGGTHSASQTITVGSGNDAPQNGSCPAVSTVGPRAGFTDIGNLRFDLKPGEIGTKEFTFPNDGRRQLKIGTIFGTISETPYGTDVQVSVSECPGQFTGPSVPAGCVGNYSRNGGSLYIGDTTECTLEDNKTYYVNLRHVKYLSSPAANSCVAPPFGYCTHYTRFNSF